MDQKLSDFVIERNKEQSDQFCDPSMRNWRFAYRAQHPTEIAVFKCMDGRLNISVITNTPAGIIQPFRNIGGKFNLGWPFLGELMKEWVDYSLSQRRNCLVFVTYHFSAGDPYRGCKGFNFKTEEAKQSAVALSKQFERVYGKLHRIVHPIVVGIETDEDALIFHGEEGLEFRVSEHLEDTQFDLEIQLKKLYPSMMPQTLMDVLPLIAGNQARIKELRSMYRPPVALDHGERIIAVGRGFDWLHQPNLALIVGPYGHDWPSAVATAGSILLDNLHSGRIPEREGVLLLISSLSRKEKGSHDWNTAVEKARYLQPVALEALQKGVPELTPHLSVLSGVLDASTRLFHPLP